jgi:hypothetical protein
LGTKCEYGCRKRKFEERLLQSVWKVDSTALVQGSNSMVATSDRISSD